MPCSGLEIAIPQILGPAVELGCTVMSGSRPRFSVKSGTGFVLPVPALPVADGFYVTTPLGSIRMAVFDLVANVLATIQAHAISLNDNGVQRHLPFCVYFLSAKPTCLDKLQLWTNLELETTLRRFQDCAGSDAQAVSCITRSSSRIPIWEIKNERPD
jgi:hypothetical protein